MKTRKHSAGSCLLIALILLFTPGFASQDSDRLVTANGKGTIKVGNEEFPLYTVVLRLKQDGVLELTLVSELNLSFSGTWSENADKSVDMKISVSAQSSWEGTGKVVFRDNGKSIARLSMDGANRLRKAKVAVQFEAN